MRRDGTGSEEYCDLKENVLDVVQTICDLRLWKKRNLQAPIGHDFFPYLMPYYTGTHLEPLLLV